MKKLIQLHSYLGSTYYAVVFSSAPEPVSVAEFEKFLKKIFSQITADVSNIGGFTCGMFSGLTNDQINGASMVQNKTSNYLYVEEAGGVSILFDYIKQEYIDWPKTFEEQGDESAEFKVQHAFSYQDSLKTALLSKGISEGELERAYLFKLHNYNSEIPYVLPDNVTKCLENEDLTFLYSKV